MAIPGTREYYDEFMAKKRAAEAAAIQSSPAVTPESVGLDVPMRSAGATPIVLDSSLPPIDRGGDISIAPAPRMVRTSPDLPHGPDGSDTPAPPTRREAALASMRARGLPTPGQEIAAAEGEAADTYEQAGLGGLSMQGAKMLQSVRNPEYGITRDYVKTSSSINDRAMEAQRVIDDAEMLRAHKVADFMDEQNARQAEALTDMKARHFAQEEQDIEAQQRTKAAYGLMAETTQRLMEGPDRWWASRSDGQKAGAFLGMLGRGLSGGNPSDFLNERIDRELDALKSASAAAATQGNMARGMYADIRARAQDQREADAIYAAARAEQMKQQFEAFAARSAIPSVMAQQQQSRLALEQMVADRRLALEKIAVHNVKSRTIATPAYRIVKDPQTGALLKVPTAGPGQMAAAKYMLEEASKSRGDARKVLGDEASERAKASVKAAEQQSADDLQERKFQFEQRAKMVSGEKMQSVSGALQAGAAYLKKYGEDVPGRTEGTLFGRGFTSPIGSKERQEERAQLDTFVQWAAASLTGANVSDQQEQFFDRVLRGEDLSGDQIRSGIRMTMDTLEAVRSANERALEPRAAAKYRGVDEQQLPEFDPLTGGRVEGGTVEDEAKMLGGTLR